MSCEVLLPSDGVAQQLEEVVQQLEKWVQLQDAAISLRALPPEVLSIVLRHAGRRTRRVSHRWKSSYGPLTCGIKLNEIPALSRLLASGPTRFHHVTSLVLCDPPSTSHHTILDYQLSVVAAAFPRLRCLNLSGLKSASLGELQSLQPLSTTLTILKLPEVDVPFLPAMTSIAQLTSLRSLSLTYTRKASRDLLSFSDALRQLSSLPHLQDLRFPWAFFRPFPVSPLLPSLCSLSGLTHLGLEYIELEYWDQEATSALRSGLPRLSSLFLLMNFEDAYDAGGQIKPGLVPCHAVMAALAQRTALHSLRMGLEGLATEVHNLSSLSALQQLRNLRVSVNGFVPHAAISLGALLQAMAVGKSLTCLRVDIISDTPRLSEGAVVSLGELTGLQKLSLCVSVDPVRRIFRAIRGLSRLTHLALNNCKFSNSRVNADAVREASRQLASLTQLQVLKLSPSKGCRVVPAVLEFVSALTNLRQLSLGTPYSYLNESALHSDWWRRSPLGRSLTRLELAVGPMPWPALARLMGCLPRLQHLQLSEGILQDPRLARHLLPLPPALTGLHLKTQSYRYGDGINSAVLVALQDAAAAQDCCLQVGPVWH